MVDYYKTLEIPRNAILSDIKKAYHRLALKWHPDKNPNNKEEADRRFKEISEAYEVLSDGEKRIIYDQYGKEGLTRDGGRRGPRSFGTDDFFGHSHFVFRDPEEVFREFFGGDPFANFFEPVMTNPSHGSMQTSIFGPTLTMFTGFRGFPDFFGGDPGFTSFSSSLSTGNYGTPSGNIRRTSTSTRFVNGKKITTKRVMENGVETVTVVEDGEVRSKTVNGVPQALGY